jgi:hypothetical protein
VASEKRPTGPAAKDRTRDAEALAAVLFAELFRAERATKQPAGIARDALAAARAFYEVCDTPAKE